MAALTTPTATAVAPSSNANISSGTAGASVVIGTPVYLDTAAARVVKPANASTEAASIVAGIALNSAASGQKVFYATRDRSFTHGFTASEINPGAVVYLDDASGAMTITPSDLDAGDYQVIIGQINNPETTMNLIPTTGVLKG